MAKEKTHIVKAGTAPVRPAAEQPAGRLLLPLPNLQAAKYLPSRKKLNTQTSRSPQSGCLAGKRIAKGGRQRKRTRSVKQEKSEAGKAKHELRQNIYIDKGPLASIQQSLI